MEERNRGRRLCDQNARDSSGFLNGLVSRLKVSCGVYSYREWDYRMFCG